MADTRQVLQWSIERPCPFRGGTDNWFLPGGTSDQLREIAIVSSAAKDNRILDGICVTSWTTGEDCSGAIHEIPRSGFQINQKLDRFGGLQNIDNVCGQCSANAHHPNGSKLAGCHGYLDIWPDSPELEDQLWKSIRDRNLEGKLRSLFQVTTPLWYGFWMDSPLRASQVEFLIELFDPLCDRNDAADNDAVHFLNALTTAVRCNANVHVEILPPGHADLNYYTVFPHCPRCKAAAAVDRWQTSYDDQNYRCGVCENVFNPNAHHSSQHDEFKCVSEELQDVLGEERLSEFTKQFLMYRGCTAPQADEVIDIENHGPVMRQIEQVLRRNVSTARSIVARKTANEPAHAMRLTLAENTDIEFVLVPAGKFLMGAIEGEDQRILPLHEVVIPKPFYMAKYPITQDQWLAVMGATNFHDEGSGLPVDQVSWFDCQSFCDETCNRFKRIVRLPSEAEWEYACRAGTTTRYAYGDTIAPEQANYRLSSAQRLQFVPAESEIDEVFRIERDIERDEKYGIRSKPKITAVGSYPPNAWGIYDMHGNVSEWCADAWHENYQGAPVDGRAWEDVPLKNPYRVIRGGDCSSTEVACSSAHRAQQRADVGHYMELSSSDGSDEAGVQMLLSMFEDIRTPQGFRIVFELEA